MRQRLIFVGILIVAFFGLAGVHAEEPRYDVVAFGEWQKIPTQAVWVTEDSLENALYNWVYAHDVLWEAMNSTERRQLIQHVLRFNRTGLGLKVRLPKTLGLKGVEIDFAPFSNGQESVIAVNVNLRAKEKGGWSVVKPDQGMFMLFKVENQQMVVNFFYNNADALREADKEIAKRPEDPQAWMNKANIYDFSDQRKAIDFYKEIIERFPDCAGAYNNLAMIYTGYTNPNLMDPNRAVELALKACELTKYEELGHVDTLARAYFLQGQQEKALEIARANLQKKNEVVYHMIVEWMEINLP